MASTTLGHDIVTAVGRSSRGLWSRLNALALRLNGTSLPLVLDKADRGTLQGVLDG